MEKINIAGHELTSGKTIKDYIHVGGTEIHIPHIIICGEKPGKTVLVTAGIHNAEYVGIQAAIELSNEISPKDLVYYIPILYSNRFIPITRIYRH